jgi:hypothetical protein
MTQKRSTSKHHRRRTAGLLLSVAALAIAFSVGPGGYRHLNSGSSRVEMALGGGQGGGSGGGFGHWRAKSGARGAAGSQSGTTGGQHQAYGPGEGDAQSDWGGYMPNGEDGLTTLADFVHGHDGGNNPNQGTQHGWDGKPDDPSTQIGSGGPQSSGGGYTGGGGGGGLFGNGGNGGAGGNGGTGGNGGNGGNGGAGGAGGTGGNGGAGGDGGGGPGTGGPGGPTFTGDPGDGDNGCVINCGKPAGNDDPPGPRGDPSLNSAVPEPAVWMMLILGFGVLGTALRVQRRKVPRVLA